jgi:hypothetical protein
MVLSEPRPPLTPIPNLHGTRFRHANASLEDYNMLVAIIRGGSVRPFKMEILSDAGFLGYGRLSSGGKWKR